jgi:hypothetical protein
VAYSSELDTHVSLGRIPSMLEVDCLACVFPMRTRLTCDRNTSYLSAFSSGRNISFMENSLFSCIEETHVSIGRILSLLEAAVSCPCFLMRTELACEGILPIYQCFHVVETFTSWEIALLS